MIPVSRAVGLMAFVAGAQPLMSVIEGTVGAAQIAAAGDAFQK